MDDHGKQRNRRLEQAVQACAEGHPEGVDVILELEGAQLFGVALRILTRHDLAEEAVQDAMVLIWRKSPQQRGPAGSARGWIYAILRNRCLTILRDGRRLSSMSPEELTRMQDARDQIVPEQPIYITSTHPAGLVTLTVAAGVTLTSVLMLVAAHKGYKDRPDEQARVRLTPSGLHF